MKYLCKGRITANVGNPSAFREGWDYIFNSSQHTNLDKSDIATIVVGKRCETCGWWMDNGVCCIGHGTTDIKDLCEDYILRTDEDS